MPNEKILVVDDDTNICELLRLYLEKEGYVVKIVNDGVSAINAFKQENPDLTLLDIMIPKLDGWQVCREIRKFSDKPIIMLTAKGETFDKVLGLELGADDYVTKPFDTKEVVARIKAVLRRTAPASDTSDVKEVNYDKLEELVEWQIEQGTDAIVIVGTTGESSTLTTEEHSDVIRAAVRFAKHRVPVIAGTGSNCTREAIHLSEEAEKAGADGLLAVTPYYNKATQGGLIRYYTEIAEAVKLPIIMYNVPGRTGCNIMPETAATLFKNVENIVGIKEATGSLAQASKLMYLTDGKIDLYSGEDGIVVPLMAIGAIGVISVWSNVAPADVHDMCAAFSAGDLLRARELQLKAQPLVDALFSEVNPIPVKKALNLMGLEVGPLRSPLTEMTPENAAKLAEAMKNYGIKLA